MSIKYVACEDAGWIQDLFQRPAFVKTSANPWIP